MLHLTAQDGHDVLQGFFTAIYRSDGAFSEVCMKPGCFPKDGENVLYCCSLLDSWPDEHDYIIGIETALELDSRRPHSLEQSIV